MTISTLSFNTSTRTSLLRLQGEISELTQQVNNGGRINDVGRELGRLTGSSISARSVAESLKEQQTSNGILDRRLKSIDAAMATVSEGAETVANNLIGVSIGKDWPNVVLQAKSGMAQLTSALNSSDAGSYLFGGIQTDKAPAKAYEGSAAQTATATNFAAFYAATGAASVSQITADQMKAYLGDGYPVGVTPNTKFSDLVADPAWGANWSSASSDKGSSRISGTETVVAAASANDKPFRSIAAAYTMLSDLNIAGLNDSARAVVLDTASKQLKEASNTITATRAELGTTRKRIETANSELLRQQDIMQGTVDTLEEEDVTEIGLRVNALTTQLNAAYAVTAKIQKLSILDYL